MKVLSLIFAMALLIPMASAQTPDATTGPSGSGGTVASASVAAPVTRGIVVEYSPGVSMVLNPGSGEPLHYRFAKTVTYINDEGRTITPDRIKKNAIVRVYYTKEGNDMIVDKVILND